MSLEDLRELDAGVKEMCTMYGVNLLGGDTSASLSGLFINVTVIGEAQVETVLYRNGASPGDIVYVTGNLGDANAGLKLLKGDLKAPRDIRERLIAAHNRPVPQVTAGHLIATSMLASAMIDISDGLASDLRHICEESGVGARIVEEHLPLSEELKAFCAGNDLDPHALALTGGEDYELIFTVPEKNAASLEKAMKSGGYPVYRIGGIVTGSALRLVSPDGTEKEMTRSGFDHFEPASQ